MGDSNWGHFVSHLVHYTKVFFPGMVVRVHDEPLSFKQARTRKNDFGHVQYVAEDIFDVLSTISADGTFCKLGITFEDLCEATGKFPYVGGFANATTRLG